MTSENFLAVIGLEIHAQLKTKSKLFCSCSTGAASEASILPNSCICPICTGHPGALPKAINRRAVVLATRVALACHCHINRESSFERKNYFYPDLPKGYQITQYFHPLANNGWLEYELIDEIKKVNFRRIHLEEDAGKSKHENGNWLIDMNRCGIPLIELVTDPDFHSGIEAKVFLQELHRLLRYLNVSDARMELGNFRCDVNVSILLLERID